MLIDLIIGNTRALLRPPTDITVTQWAEKNRILSPENCALPGPYRVAVTPYLREILDCINDPNIEKIVCQKSAQVAWTDGVINNAIGYYIDHDPTSMLTLFPTEHMAERYSKEKLAPMIRDTDCLRGKVADPKSRDSGNTILSKNFPGGHLELVGSNAPANLASSPIRVVLVEEPDRCARNSGGEGNSLKLVYERSKTFFNRKLILGGSPTIKGVSEIEREMRLTDQRYYYVPCPICREYQVLKWSNVIWDKKLYTNHEVFGDYLPETARLKCISCGKSFSNAEKNEQLRHGIWRASAAFSGAVGFYMSELMSPFPKARLQDIAAKFLEAKKHMRAGDHTLMITFVNTSLGETWEEKGIGADNKQLLDRLEPFTEDQIDERILTITCGVDVQDDRLELEMVGWGIGQESWGLGYTVLEGDPEMPDVWTRLDEILFSKEFNCNGITLRIKCTGIDSGAHTNAVYNYILGKPPGKKGIRQAYRIYPVKGKSTTGDPVVGKPSNRSIKKGLNLYPIGVDSAKDVIYGRLAVDEPGPGYCHFPDDYPDEYFKQLTAEEKVTRYERGVIKKLWIKKRPRNEALDIRVYSLAALMILNPNFDALLKKADAAREVAKRETAKAETEAAKRIEFIAERQHRKRPRKGGFINNW